TGLLGAYAVHNMFVFDNLVSYILFFSFLAYIHTLSRPEENKTLVNLELEKGLVETVIAPVVIVATFCAIYVFNWNAYFASRTLIDALQQQKGGPAKNLELFKKVFEYDSFGNTEAREQLSMMASQILRADVDPSVQQQFLALIRKQVEEQIKETPSDARAYVFAGALFSQIGLLNEAEKYIEKASVLSPNKQSILLQLGENKLNLGKLDEALPIFKKAYELVPAHDEARNIYISVLVYAKQEKEAEQILMETYGTTVIADGRLLQAYVNIGNFKKALPIAMLLIEKEPQNIKHHFALAVILYKLGQTTKAIAELNTIVKIDPNTKDQIDGYIKSMQAGKEIQ
ncbi:tetratricopeptide repeat protein, partial [Patescibacteria group bacterium]